LSQAAEARRLPPWLIAGVVIFPIIFSWFTLRRGYSAHVRRGAFLLAAFNFLPGLFAVIFA
jgi:hypothetical protein